MAEVHSNSKEGDQTNLSSRNVRVDTIKSLLMIASHLLIGVIVGSSLAYACRNGIDIGPTSQHIILCVIGYQLLIGQAILCLAPDSWSSKLSLKSRRRVHWILQVVGSILALTGCIIKSIHKTSKGVNYNTLHGQFGLAAMIFTGASLINGLSSLYSFELRNYLPAHYSKLTHICFGILAYSCSSICLVYGFNKTTFRSWASDSLTDAFIIMTGVLTVILIFNPLINFCQKFTRVLKL